MANSALIALQNIQARQSTAQLRKESGSSLVTLLGTLVTILSVVTESVPAEYSWVAAILTGVAAGISFYIDRFTVPAVTNGQRRAIEEEISGIEEAQAQNRAPGLPVYNGPSTQDDPESPSAPTE